MKKLLVLDVAISQHIALAPQSIWQPFIRRLAHIGDGHRVLVALVLSGLVGLLLGDYHLCQMVLITGPIVVLTSALVTSIKFTVRRARPRPPGEFVAFEYDRYSFPSGHSARMSSLAIGVIYFYPLLGSGLMVLAMAVAASRVLVGVHYLSDILVGLGVGMMVAYMLLGIV